MIYLSRGTSLQNMTTSGQRLSERRMLCAEEDDDDPVIATFDVCNATSLAESLHLFQYPLRTADRPYENHSIEMYVTSGAELAPSGALPAATPSSASMRGLGAAQQASVLQPLSRVTLQCVLDSFQFSQNFPASAAGSRFSLKSASLMKSEDEGDDISGTQMPSDQYRYRYALYSEPAQSRSDYAVGIFRDGALHLTPVSSVRQFGPAVGRNKALAQHRGSGGSTGALNVEEEHASRKPDDALVSGPIADILMRQLRRQRSYAINGDAKTSQRVEYYKSDTVESNTVAKRLLSSTLAVSVPASSSSAGKPRPVRPVEAVFPADGTLIDNTVGRKEFVWKFAADVGIAAQVRDLITSCQIISVEHLMKLLVPPSGGQLSGATTDASVLESVYEGLRASAMMLHGVWIAKTSELFRGNAAAMRELILLQFWKSADGTVKRDDVVKLIGGKRGGVSSAQAATIKEILETIAYVDFGVAPADRRWRLRELPGDGSAAAIAAFLKAFEQARPQDAQFQARAWSKREEPILSHVSFLEAGKLCRTLYLPSSTAATQQQQPATTSASASPLKMVARPAASSSLSGSSAVSPGSVAGSTLNDPNVEKVREFTRALFVEHGVINKQRAKEMISKAREEHFPHATNQMLSVAVQEEVQQFTAATWALKVLKLPQVDMYRPAIMAAALELDNFESSVVIARAIAIFNQRAQDQGKLDFAPITSMPTTVTDRVLREIAIFRQGERLWHLKSGNIL